MITALTGISNAMVVDEEPIEVVLPCLLEFLGDAVLVAHNASFDTRFLQAALQAHAYPAGVEHRLYSAAGRVLLPRDEVPNVKLATLARYLRAGSSPATAPSPTPRPPWTSCTHFLSAPPASVCSP